MRELRDRRDGGRVIATRRHFWRLLATFGTRVDRPRFGMAGEGVTAMIVGRGCRRRRQPAGGPPRGPEGGGRAGEEGQGGEGRLAGDAMAAVRAQLDLREKGAADKAANKANDDAGAPVGRRLRCSNECSLPASTIPNISNKCFARLREREREIWYPRVRRRRSQRQGDGDASGWAAPESKGHRGLPVLRREIG